MKRLRVYFTRYSAKAKTGVCLYGGSPKACLFLMVSPVDAHL